LRTGAPAGGAQLRPRPGALHRLRLRLGARAPHHAALWHRRRAPVLRRRPSFPRAVLMNVPESWLRTFCDPALSGEKLAERLTMAGIEVESHAPVWNPPFRALVAELLSVEKHPNADKLTVSKVRTDTETVKVV